MRRLEYVLEYLLFNSRWLLAPLYIGLVLTIGMLMVKFVRTFILFVPTAFNGSGNEVIIGVLSLIDVVMIANLLIIMVFAGYENFVSHIDVGDRTDRPAWMGHVGFSDQKIKLIGSIVAISAIELLKAGFADGNTLTSESLGWKLALHLTLIISGVLFALMDRISEGRRHED